VLAVQVVGNVYTIVVVPAVMPATTPLELPTEAMPVALLLHLPPDGLSLSVIVNPAHTLPGPVIVPGNGLMVTVVVLVAVQPEPDALIVTV
jgi:hypothetical protein